MESRPFDDIRLGLTEETRAKLIWCLCAQSKRRENASRKVPTVVGHDESGFPSDGGYDHVRVACIGQCDGAQCVGIRGNIRTRKGLLHFAPRPVETGYRIAKFVAAASHPLVVDGI